MANYPDAWRGTSFPDPFQEMARLKEDMNRVLSEVMGTQIDGGVKKFEFSPSCEFCEEDKSFVLKFDLPGIKKDQVKVEAEGNRLTVRAERKTEGTHTSKKKHLSEISYGSYMRSFTLPQKIDEAKVDAKFEDGVLIIHIPKTETMRDPKQISVH